MKKTNIVAAAAVAAAGIATYMIRKRLRSRKETNDDHTTQEVHRHITNVFAKAKLASKKAH